MSSRSRRSWWNHPESYRSKTARRESGSKEYAENPFDVKSFEAFKLRWAFLGMEVGGSPTERAYYSDPPFPAEQRARLAVTRDWSLLSNSRNESIMRL